MNEIRAAAKAVAGVELGVELVDVMIGVDPIDMYNPPSMLVDVRNVSVLFFSLYLSMGFVVDADE